MRIYKLEWLEDMGQHNGQIWRNHGYYQEREMANAMGGALRSLHRDCKETRVTEIYVIPPS